MSSNDKARSRLGRLARSALIFSIVPMTFFVAVSALTRAKGPQWLPYSFENPYNYLFNSLLLVKGQAPYCIDHPGTTTQVFGATVLRASSLRSNEDLISHVIRQPEAYIRLLHWALLSFTGLVLWLVPWLTAEAIRNRIIGILIQAPSLFYSTLIFYGMLFGPDLMLVPFSVAAVCCCTLLVTQSGSKPQPQAPLGIGDKSTVGGAPRLVRIPILPLLAGLVCALGIVTKLTFFPLVLITIVFCRTKENLLTFAIAFIFGSSVALLPIYTQLPRFAAWALAVGVHSGRYDAGPVGLPQSSVYLSSLSDLISEEPLVVIIPIVATILVLAFALLPGREPLTSKIAWRTALVLLGLQLFSVLLIAKERGSHYLIPLCLTTALNLIFLFQACRSIAGSGLRKTMGWAMLVVLVGLGVKSFVQETPGAYAELHSEKVNELRLYQVAQEITKNDTRVDYFFSDSPIYPLMYGNNLAGGAFSSQLAVLYPKALSFNVFNQRFQTFTGFIDPKVVLQKYDHLYFLGDPEFFPKTDELDPATFETIDHADAYYLQKWTRKQSDSN